MKSPGERANFLLSCLKKVFLFTNHHKHIILIYANTCINQISKVHHAEKRYYQECKEHMEKHININMQLNYVNVKKGNNNKTNSTSTTNMFLPLLHNYNHHSFGIQLPKHASTSSLSLQNICIMNHDTACTSYPSNFSSQLLKLDIQKSQKY